MHAHSISLVPRQLFTKWVRKIMRSGNKTIHIIVFLKYHPTSPGKLDAKGGEGRGVGVPSRLVRGGTRGRGQRRPLTANPFLKTTGTLTPSKIQPQLSQNNPFLAQITKHQAPILSSNVTDQAGPPPPSYASVVSGNRQGQQQARFPVPSFISHGPNSIPVFVSDIQGDAHRNPFLDQQTSLSTVELCSSTITTTTPTIPAAFHDCSQFRRPLNHWLKQPISVWYLFHFHRLLPSFFPSWQHC